MYNDTKWPSIISNCIILNWHCYLKNSYILTYPFKNWCPEKYRFGTWNKKFNRDKLLQEKTSLRKKNTKLYQIKITTFLVIAQNKRYITLDIFYWNSKAVHLLDVPIVGGICWARTYQRHRLSSCRRGPSRLRETKRCFVRTNYLLAFRRLPRLFRLIWFT